MNRFGIWQKVEKHTSNCIGLGLEASLSTRNTKGVLIRELRVQIEIIKHLCRICHDIKILEQRKYILLQERLQEISKMASGWEKYTR